MIFIWYFWHLFDIFFEIYLMFFIHFFIHFQRYSLYNFLCLFDIFFDIYLIFLWFFYIFLFFLILCFWHFLPSSAPAPTQALAGSWDVYWLYYQLDPITFFTHYYTFSEIFFISFFLSIWYFSLRQGDLIGRSCPSVCLSVCPLFSNVSKREVSRVI